MRFYTYEYNEEGYHNGKKLIEGKHELAMYLTSEENMRKHIVVTDEGDELVMELDHFKPVGFGYGATEEEIIEIIDEMKRCLDERVGAK